MLAEAGEVHRQRRGWCWFWAGSRCAERSRSSLAAWLVSEKWGRQAPSASWRDADEETGQLPTDCLIWLIKSAGKRSTESENRDRDRSVIDRRVALTVFDGGRRPAAGRVQLE